MNAEPPPSLVELLSAQPEARYIASRLCSLIESSGVTSLPLLGLPLSEFASGISGEVLKGAVTSLVNSGTVTLSGSLVAGASTLPLCTRIALRAETREIVGACLKAVEREHVERRAREVNLRAEAKLRALDALAEHVFTAREAVRKNAHLL